MFCPECGADLEWVAVDGEPGGGWWQCESEHRWRRSFGGLAPVEA